MNRVVLSAFAVAALAGIAQADVYTGGTFGAIPDATVSNSATGWGGTTFSLNATNGANPTIVSFNRIAIGMNHTWVGDLLITLTSPGGQTADVLVRAGVNTATGFGNGDNVAFTAGNAYVFYNSGQPAFPLLATGPTIPTGDYNRVPRANATVVATGFSGNDFTVFNGGDVNGNWILTVRDFGNQDVGEITGWSLDITTVPTPGAAALLGLGGLVIGRRRR